MRREVPRMIRALIILILVIAFAGHAEAGTLDRETWLRWNDGGPDARRFAAMWSAGVGEVLYLVAQSSGCAKPAFVSGNALTAVTADLLREHPARKPLTAAIEAYATLSGCY